MNVPVSVYSIARKVAIVLFFATIAVFGTLGYNYGVAYYFAMLLCFVPLAAYLLLRKSHRRLLLRSSAAARWAAPRTRSYDFNAMKQFVAEGVSRKEPMVDDQTWNDLDMDSLFREVDMTFTAPGRVHLYRVLHTILPKHADIDRQERLATALQDDGELRGDLLISLAAIGDEKQDQLTPFVFDEPPDTDSLRSLFYGMSVAAVIALFSPFFIGLSTGIIAIIVVLLINMWLYYRKARNISSLVPALAGLSRLVASASSLAGTNLRSRPKVAQALRQDDLKEHLRHTGKLRRAFRWILTGAPSSSYSVSADLMEMLFVYVKIYFLIDLVAFARVSAELRREIEHVRAIYRIVGALDAAQAIAGYREYRKRWTRPVFEEGTKRLSVEKLFHPLLERAVANSITLDGHGAIITGSNMAGKSTFLRTLGVNAILAQTIGTCFASKYEGTRFFVMSSIEKGDTLEGGKSFYYMEAERIYRMINAVTGRYPLLCLIDELLAGTNSLERINASIAILHYLQSRDALSVVATHDIAIAKTLEGTYPTYHFTDRTDEKGLTFDYKIKSGIVTTRNAIRLLEMIGYPPDIISEALRLAESPGRTLED